MKRTLRPVLVALAVALVAMAFSLMMDSILGRTTNWWVLLIVCGLVGLRLGWFLARESS